MKYFLGVAMLAPMCFVAFECNTFHRLLSSSAKTRMHIQATPGPPITQRSEVTTFARPVLRGILDATQDASIVYHDYGCGGLQTALNVYVKNANQTKRISVTIERTTVEVTNGNTTSTDQVYPPPEANANSESPSIGCTAKLDTSNINNPRTFTYKYKVLSAKYVP